MNNNDYINWAPVEVTFGTDIGSIKGKNSTEVEYNEFLSKYRDLTNSGTLNAPIEHFMNKEGKSIFILSTNKSSKSINIYNIGDKIRKFYGHIIGVEYTYDTKRPHYFDLNNGKTLFHKDLKEFVIGKGEKWYLDKEKSKKIRCIALEDNKSIQKYLDIEEFNTYSCSYLDTKEQIKVLCTVKITSCNESIELFGYKNIKNQMLETQESFTISNIHKGFICKKDKERRNIIEVNNNGKAYKFLLSEVKLIFPDLSKLINSYKEPKKRDLVTGTQVKVIKTKHTTIPLKSKVKLLELKKVGNKEYALVEFNKKTSIINKKYLKVI